MIWLNAITHNECVWEVMKIKYKLDDGILLEQFNQFGYVNLDVPFGTILKKVCVVIREEVVPRFP